jgi:peptide deformylase
MFCMTKTKVKKIEILQNGNPILRKESLAIPTDMIKTPEVKKIISLLRDAIDSQCDAAAISAVQIGKPIRLFVISKRILKLSPKKEKEARIINDLIFINPKIVKVSKTKQLLEEGCLSVRYIYGKVLRPEKVTIEAYDEFGKKFSRGFSGLLAQITQHENDHLNGILFIDKATDIEEISHEEYEQMLKEV